MMKMDGWITTEIQFYSISPSVLVFPFSFENGSTLVATIATSSEREKTRSKPKCRFYVFLNIDCYMSHLWLSSSLQQSRLEWNQNSPNTETHLLGNVLDCCFSRSIYICKQCELTLWRRIFLESSVFFHKVEKGVNLWKSSNRIPEVELCTPMLKHLTDKHTRHKSKQTTCTQSFREKETRGHFYKIFMLRYCLCFCFISVLIYVSVGCEIYVGELASGLNTSSASCVGHIRKPSSQATVNK